MSWLAKLDRFLAAFLLLAVSASFPAAAQDAEPARFLIESITVEGIQRASAREIVASESRLREGESYTEQELREAVYRVKRLPFVLDAEFSLRKGSERGTYELVITVEQTRPLFFLVESNGYLRPSDETPFRPQDRFDVYSQATLGARHFIGARGLLFASIEKGESGEPNLQLGYTQYNLFGPGSFVSLTGFRTLDDVYGSRTEGALTLGVPLTANTSLRSTFSWAEQSFDSSVSESFYEQSSEDWSGTLDWIYDTTDDPLFPTQGDRVVGSVFYSTAEVRLETEAPGIFEEQRLESEDYGVSLQGRRHYRLTQRQALGLGMATQYFQLATPAYDEESEFFRGNVSALHSTSLWGFEKTERFGDLRLENGVELTYDRSTNPFAHRDVTAATLRSSLVFRSAWGLVRASLSYTDVLEASR